MLITLGKHIKAKLKRLVLLSLPSEELVVSTAKKDDRNIKNKVIKCMFSSFNVVDWKNIHYKGSKNTFASICWKKKETTTTECFPQ